MDGPATKWQVGLRTFLTPSVKEVAAIQLGTASGLFYDNAYIAGQINAGFTQSGVPPTQLLLGVAGSFTRFIDSVDWLFYDTLCTCDTSDFIKPSTIRDMAATIVGGDFDTVPIPSYVLQY